MRRPAVVAFERYTITNIRQGRSIRVRRWYVTLRFGHVLHKVPVSAATVRWLRGL